ncbi:MAG: hypothetical protein PVI26_03780 [Chitinispirillia bacterium]|jgi:hypothetical protein
MLFHHNITAYSILLIIYIISFISSAEIIVNTFDELLNAVKTGNPKDTLLLTDGIYNIENTWSIPIEKDGMVIKGQSDDRSKVIINGRGMKADGHHGFWVNAPNVTICDLTIQNVRNHCIQTNINTDGLHVKNCILRDAGEQLLKVPKGDSNNPSENGVVENCLFEYSAGIGPQYYIGGIDCHFSKDWIVRNNVFKYIRSPEDKIAEHAIHFWSSSENTIVERNLIIDCDRGIGFGLGSSAHLGGIIRNNMIYHKKFDGPDRGDVGIALESSPNTRIYNNTVFLEHEYTNSIEYRFSETNNVYIANNLTNKRILSRNGAEATLECNYENAEANWFENANSGNLHINSHELVQIIDRGANITGLDNDFDGNLRPNGSGIDIGADEFFETAILNKTTNYSYKYKAVIFQDYPIERNSTSYTSFFIPFDDYICISLYDISGRQIKKLYEQYTGNGFHTISWNTSNIAREVYMLILSSPSNNIFTSQIVCVYY